MGVNAKDVGYGRKVYEFLSGSLSSFRKGFNSLVGPKNGPLGTSKDMFKFDRSAPASLKNPVFTLLCRLDLTVRTTANQFESKMQ